MMSTRQMMGAIGLLGIAGWSFICWLAFQFRGWGDGSVSSHMSSEALLFAFAPIAVFVFYFVIAVWPCRAVIAFIVGLILHVPLVFIAIRLLKIGHEAPIYVVALSVGPVVWLLYLRALARHDNSTPR